MHKASLGFRIDRAEQSAKNQSRFFPECICFPEKEQPFFVYSVQESIAAAVKCPLHGNRFKQPIFHIYVSKWQRDRQEQFLESRSPQYRKAWDAAFPRELWPGVEERMDDGNIYLRLKDGSRLLPCGTKRMTSPT